MAYDKRLTLQTRDKFRMGIKFMIEPVWKGDSSDIRRKNMTAEDDIEIVKLAIEVAKFTGEFESTEFMEVERYDEIYKAFQENFQSFKKIQLKEHFDPSLWKNTPSE